MTLQDLLDELASTQALSDELDTLLEQTQADLAGLTAHFHQGLGQLQAIVTQQRSALIAQGQQLQAALQSLHASDLPNAKAIIDELAQQVQALDQSLTAVVATVQQAAAALSNDIAQHQEAATEALDQVRQGIEGVQQNMSDQFALGLQGIGELSAALETEQGHWVQLIEDVGNDLQAARAALASHLGSVFSEAVAHTVQEYGGALAELDQNALRNPLGTLRDEAREEINQAVLRAFDVGLAELENAVRALGERIAGASERTDAENKAIDEVLQTLKEFAGPLMERIGRVEDLMNAVGLRT